MTAKIFQLAAFLFLVSCASVKTETASSSLPKGMNLTVSAGDGLVGEYISSWTGFRTSSYWIEGPSGLILIDTQFLLSSADEMVNWAEKMTGKKAVLAIVLHPNPDKFNGTSVLQKRGIKVITSSQVLKLIPEVHQLRTEWFFDRYKPDYPTVEPQPESFGDRDTEIEAAGIKIKLHVLGAGCSAQHVVVQVKDHVFVGDLITQGFHSWLELGKLKDWLARLNEIKAMKPKFIHTGRGGSGDADLISKEQSYLESVVKIVKKHKSKNKVLTEAASERIEKEIFQAYPLLEYKTFVSTGIEAVWDDL